MKQGYTDITVVLDRSGSMTALVADTIGGYNTFLKAQKEAPGEAKLTLVQFDTEYEFLEQGVEIKNAKPLNSKRYVPRGSTALLDAIGRSINEAGARFEAMDESERPDMVVFVILTDGEENSSREFAKAQIKSMIEHQTEVYKWSFVYLGANQDSFSEAGGMGIGAATTMNLTNNSRGLQAAYASISGNLTAARSGGGSAAMDWTEEDRELQEKAAKD